MYNILLASPSPRDLPEFLECIEKVDYIDKLFIKYTAPEVETYKQIRNYFLEHTEYDYLTIVPDDTTFDPNIFKILIDDINRYKFDVITGYSNISLNNMNTYTLSIDPVSQYRDRTYNLLTKSTLFDKNGKSKFGRYFKVKWLGFSLTTIKRKVIEKIEFEDDARYNNHPYGTGCCVDTIFSFQCNRLGINMWADINVNITHLRVGDGSLLTNFYVGKKPPKTLFVKKQNTYIPT